MIHLLLAEVVVRLRLPGGHRKRAQLCAIARGLCLDASPIEVIPVRNLPDQPNPIRSIRYRQETERKIGRQKITVVRFLAPRGKHGVDTVPRGVRGNGVRLA